LCEVCEEDCAFSYLGDAVVGCVEYSCPCVVSEWLEYGFEVLEPFDCWWYLFAGYPGGFCLFYPSGDFPHELAGVAVDACFFSGVGEVGAGW
jgi:hypothetical protein